MVAQKDQQHIADGDRRQHQRQVNEGIDDGAAGEPGAGQHPGHDDAQGQAEEHAAGGHFEAEAQGLQLGRTQSRVHEPGGVLEGVFKGQSSARPSTWQELSHEWGPAANLRRRR